MGQFVTLRALGATATLGVLGAVLLPAGDSAGAEAGGAGAAAAPAALNLDHAAIAITASPAGVFTVGGRTFAAEHSAAARRLLTAAARRARANQTDALIHRMVSAGNRIARLPYVWGGGHGSFSASGYDCSGSVSYVLHAAGLLSAPEDSTGLESFGAPGPGRHVTIYANSEHAWMTIDGRRFDTVALQENGTRWSSTIPSTAAYTVRHPIGL